MRILTIALYRVLARCLHFTNVIPKPQKSQAGWLEILSPEVKQVPQGHKSSEGQAESGLEPRSV